MYVYLIPPKACHPNNVRNEKRIRVYPWAETMGGYTFTQITVDGNKVYSWEVSFDGYCSRFGLLPYTEFITQNSKEHRTAMILIYKGDYIIRELQLPKANRGRILYPKS